MYEFQIKKMKENGQMKKWANKTFDEIQIGDIFYVSGGYEMTIVTFYKVVGKRGKSTLEVVRLANRFVEQYEVGRGKVVPDESKVTGGPFKVRCTIDGYDGSIRFLEPEYGYEHAYLWDGEPRHYNDYD